jgi:hypothetical protein
LPLYHIVKKKLDVLLLLLLLLLRSECQHTQA